MTRQPRQRRARGASAVGRRFTVDVGPIAHGGHCVARVEGRAVFVRHALPGETVAIEVTEGTEGDRFWRADAVQVLTPSPDRVAAPCQVAGPGGCGGCDFQHVTLSRQRALKAEVVREQLVRLGGLEATDPLLTGLLVQAVPDAPDDGLRWRTRVRFATTAEGGIGMRRHRSRAVVPVQDCLIAAEDALREDQLVGHPEIVEQVTVNGSTRRFSRDADGFWQVHPGAPRVLVESVLELLAPTPGETVLDLYAGVGLFAGFLGARVGERGRVMAIEGSARACAHAVRNLADLRAEVHSGPVGAVLDRLDCPPADVVVLDPPREGARAPVVAQVASIAPRAVAYVACDPAALARDVALFAGHGFRLRALRAFDLFPMTHHVECVALLTKTGSDLR
ncbi:class I SAM-dependent RNA methyltransferase [Nocardioides limicola]|uniref:class I SAM-dependent RNA methyltransferase n=1 Tax=Nocardioides limicola TaxID=2803368 RepID=UPI00193B635C|nr:TRAM domain-containing protein [Nocardioides sp. DJM-14]